MTRVLGLDLGGTNSKWTVLEVGDTDAIDVLAAGTHPTEAHGGPEVVTERLLAAGRTAIAAHGPIAAAGVGVPGLFDAMTGAIELFPNLPGPWAGFPLRARLADGLGMPVAIVNDARAFTLAEGRVGAGRGARTVVGLTLGTGVGGGVMIDGRLHLGRNGKAGEIGHQVIEPDGPPCGCGNRGCVEPLTKAATLTWLAGRPTAEEVYDAAAAGDERAMAAIRQVARYLGIALSNVLAVVGPDRIVIGGGIVAAGELVLEPIREATRARSTIVAAKDIEIVAAQLGPEAGAIGAALAGHDALMAGAAR
jgi:glucokinase